MTFSLHYFTSKFLVNIFLNTSRRSAKYAMSPTSLVSPPNSRVVEVAANWRRFIAFAQPVIRANDFCHKTYRAVWWFPMTSDCCIIEQGGTVGEACSFHCPFVNSCIWIPTKGILTLLSFWLWRNIFCHSIEHRNLIIQSSEKHKSHEIIRCSRSRPLSPHNHVLLLQQNLISDLLVHRRI